MAYVSRLDENHQIMKDYSLFDERKAAQAAAYFLHMAGGGLKLIKLMKLLYLAERVSLQRYGDTITGDAFVSMPHGPVLSGTYELMNGVCESVEGGWDAWISDREGHCVSLRNSISSPEDELLALSDSDLECLGHVWGEFGQWDAFKLRDYTHTQACPEWENPHGSSRPIPYARVLKAVGYNPEQVQAIERRLHEQRYVNAAFS
jgi:uncharacterized phage-associated protein